MKSIVYSSSAVWLLVSLASCSPSPDPNPGTGGSNPATGGTEPGGGGSPAAGGSGGGTGGAGASDNSGGSSGSGGIQGDTGGSGTGGGPVVIERPGVVTTGPDAPWQVGTPTEAPGAVATVTVDETSLLQAWIGFGGTFNEQGWDALLELPQAERDRALRLLFSPSEGANFAWGRIPLGASDYAMDRYTLCDDCTADNVETAFSIGRDEELLIPYIQAAQAVKGDIKFWASPWTPPPWMKDPQEYDGTDEGPGGTPAATFEAYIQNDDGILSAYAMYFARFIESYEEAGIPIDHIQPQNEPGYDTRYPSCLWDTGLISTFVGDYLAPTLEARGLDTDIWFGTLSNNDTYPNDISGVEGIADLLVGFGLQWNTAPRIPSIKSLKSDLLIMQTEHRCGNYPFSSGNPLAPAFDPDKPQNDYAYARESWGYLKDWIGAGVNAYSAWNMVLDTVGKNLDEQRPWPQNALLVVDRATDTLIETPAYYVFRHLSYFVDPGATVLGTSGGDALAFKNPDGSVVAVVYSDAGGQVTVTLGGKTVQAPVPAQGFATFYVEPG